MFGLCGRGEEFPTWSKLSKTGRFCSMSKKDDRHGNLKGIWKNTFHLADAIHKICSPEILGSGCRVADMRLHFGPLDLQFWKMILRDRCSTSYDLASFFCGRRNTLNRWSRQVQRAVARGRQLCTQLSILKEASQNCFILDAAKAMKPRRIASSRSNLPSSDFRREIHPFTSIYFLPSFLNLPFLTFFP